ncbi:ATP-binding protein [Actinomyces urogenitalis]|uniref:ATP-binding protein n=1 Tax=Actinomyces urogenitalis TaxID=103621 RepID=UPI0031F62E0E
MGARALPRTPSVGHLVISISDDGPGIGPAVRDRLFARFARGDASRERRTGSTGLGMCIALAIVQAHGGVLTVDSVRAEDSPAGEHGTTFTVHLPAA